MYFHKISIFSIFSSNISKMTAFRMQLLISFFIERSLKYVWSYEDLDFFKSPKGFSSENFFITHRQYFVTRTHFLNFGLEWKKSLDQWKIFYLPYRTPTQRFSQIEGGHASYSFTFSNESMAMEREKRQPKLFQRRKQSIHFVVAR